MKVLSSTGSTSYSNVQIETSCQKLVFRVTAASFDALNDVKVSVNLNNKGFGTKNVLPTLPLSHVLEIAAANEGSIQISKADNGVTIMGTVELSNEGALDVREGYLELSILGCQTSENYEVWALNNATLSGSFIDYQTTFVNQNSTKEISVEGFYQICFPTSVTQVDIQYMNGRNVVYTPEELMAVCQEINELCILDNSEGSANGSRVVTGQKNFYCLGLIGAKTVKILQSTSGNIYLVKNNDLSNI